MSGADRAARRREQRGRQRSPLPAIREPIRVSQVPTTEAERRELRKRCLKQAKYVGKTGRSAQREADRYYDDAVAEAARQVREPATQPSVLTRPGAAVPAPPAPRGMTQRASGLYVPEPEPDTQVAG